MIGNPFEIRLGMWSVLESVRRVFGSPFCARLKCVWEWSPFEVRLKCISSVFGSLIGILLESFGVPIGVRCKI